jgi:predicted dinucleotide-binding enzyme
MTITIFGTGNVGKTLAEKFISAGHSVVIGTRDPIETLKKEGPSNFSEWFKKNDSIKLKTFSEAVLESKVIVNALNGASTLSVLENIGVENFKSKIIIDISNPLDFSKGFPPTLIEGLNNSNSLGENIQNLLPAAKVIKTLNTMWCGLMLAPKLINEGQHINFICGNDQNAKEFVINILKEFGWTNDTILEEAQKHIFYFGQGYIMQQKMELSTCN